MSDSIISNEKRCFVCGTTLNLHRHHIFHGRNKDNSEREGCWVYLCFHHHDDYSKDCVHNNPAFETTLKKFCQYIWEEKNGSRDDFREIFDKSYL